MGLLGSGSLRQLRLLKVANVLFDMINFAHVIKTIGVNRLQQGSGALNCVCFLDNWPKVGPALQMSPALCGKQTEAYEVASVGGSSPAPLTENGLRLLKMWKRLEAQLLGGGGVHGILSDLDESQAVALEFKTAQTAAIDRSKNVCLPLCGGREDSSKG